jgi:hypothetical protein
MKRKGKGEGGVASEQISWQAGGDPDPARGAVDKEDQGAARRE